MHLTVIKNGQNFDTRDYGAECLSFEMDSVEQQHQYESLEGRHGLISLATTFQGRSGRASFIVKGTDHLSYQIAKTDIYRIFASQSELGIIDSRKPDRKWNVKVSGVFSFENINTKSGRVEITLQSASSFAQSVTSDLQTKSTTSFTIINDGDELIDPRTDNLVITYTGASTNLKITNNTNGDSWQYTGSSSVGNKIVLNGIRSTKDGLSIYRLTNRKLIRLQPGVNNFTLTGTSGSFTISFDFSEKFI